MIPAGKRRAKQKAETREMILESARALFEAEGFENTTMRAVAVKAEIGLGTIYKHYANKAALLAAAMLGDLTRLNDSAFGTLPDGLSLKQQFLYVSRQFYSYYTSRPALTRAYLTNVFLIDEQGFAKINAFDESYLEEVAQMVIQAQVRGEVDPGRDSGFVAMSLMANYFFVLVNFFLRYGVTDPEALLDTLGKLLDQTIH